MLARSFGINKTANLKKLSFFFLQMTLKKCYMKAGKRSEDGEGMKGGHFNKIDILQMVFLL